MTRCVSIALRPRRLTCALGAAEAPLAAGVPGERRIERRGVEVGPEDVGEVQLRVGELPQQEIADALLAAGADQQVGLGREATAPDGAR